MSRSPLPPETPRSQPEIIPPGQSDDVRMRWDSINPYGDHRIYVTRLGPFSMLGIGLLFAVIVVAVLAVFLGAVLIALPVVAILIAVAVVASFLRPRLRHPHR
jgi:hypothetical protein